jgi:hypothetical protein
MPPLLPKNRTIGPYRLLACLGGGGMGSVYLARHPHLGRFVAIKLLATRHLDNPHAVARFRQEVAANGLLRHPHIVAATDAGEDDGSPYLVMEYVPGIDLDRLLRLRGPLPIADACELARQAAEGLACIDRAGLVHRDIKPSNLLLAQDGTLRILDLGVARWQQPSGDHEQLTATGQVLGTGDYLSPEMAGGCRDLDIRSDLYSLGCTLYALLTGKPPFATPAFDTFYRKLRAHLEEPIPPIQRRRPDVPDALRDLLGHMLARDLAQRSASPVEVAERLNCFTSGHNLPGLLAGLAIEPDTNGLSAAQPAQDLPAQSRGEPAATTLASGPLAEARARQKTAPAPSRGLRWWALCAALLPLAGLALWLLRGNSQDHEDARTGPNSPAPLRFEPGRWQDLLARPPVELLGPAGQKGKWWKHDQDRHELWINCDDLGLLRLADVPVEAFDLELTFFQSPWVGGLGIVFRGRDDPGAAPGSIWGDFLLLQRFDALPAARPARLVRGYLKHSKGTTPLFLDRVVAEDAHRPLAEARRLEITVGADGLRGVVWDGEAIAGRLRDPLPEGPRRAGAHGAVGILVQASSTTIRSARLRAHPRSGE